jgi:hypothetical protein
MLEAFINQMEPLTVSLGDSQIVLKNLNTMSIQEIHSILEACKEVNRYGVLLDKVVLEDTDKVLPTLSVYNLEQIGKQWEKHCGVTLSDVVEVLTIIDKYPQQLQADLTNLTSIKTISELLSLPLIDIVTVVKSYLLYSFRKSHVIAEVQNYAQPNSPENNMEQMLSVLVNILLIFFKQEPKTLKDYFIKKKTDNPNGGLAPVDAKTKREQEARLAQWSAGSNNKDKESN